MMIFNKINDQITIKLLFVVIVPWISLAILFGFIDLEISKVIVNKESIWGKIGENYAYIPSYTLVALAITIFLGSYFKDIKKQKIIGFLISLYGFNIFLFNFLDKDYIEAYLGASIFIVILTFSLFTYKYNWKDYTTISIVIILLFIILILCVEIIKPLCGRVRFKDLKSDYSNYTPWFLPPGFDIHNKSFPSGHAAHGWIPLSLIILVNNRERKDIIKFLIVTSVIGWGLFISISRVIIGAHYASDVLFSTGIAALIIIFLHKWFYLNNQKE